MRQFWSHLCGYRTALCWISIFFIGLGGAQPSSCERIRMRVMSKTGAGDGQSKSRERRSEGLLIDTGAPLESAARVVRWRARRALNKAARLIRRG
jgi:hypothetical protein